MKCGMAAKGCGGCGGMEKPYPEALREKEQAFRKLFPDARPIVPAVSPLRYRNKVLRTFANGKTDLYAGMYKAGTHQILSVRECLLENSRASKIAMTALQILAEMGLPAYREDFRKGLLRHMQVRRCPGTGEALFTLVTGTKDFPGGQAFAARLMAACPEVKGVTQNINDRTTSAVMGFQDRLLGGKDEIRDTLSGLTVYLTSRSFYQVNSAMAEKLYACAVDAANLQKSDTVLDAYCGVGVIGMLAAKNAGQVTGIELVKPAVRCAEKAAKANGIGNIRFLCGDAAKVLQEQETHFTVVFTDPPRSGCSPEFLEALIAAAPEKIVYVSCCPETLRRDADILRAHGYKMDHPRPFDLFPYTEHVETVVLLSKGEIDSKRIRVEFPLDNMEVAAFREKATYPQIKNYVLENTGLKVSSLYISQIKRKCGLDVSDSYNKPKSEDSRVPQCPPEKEEAIIDALKHFGMIS